MDELKRHVRMLNAAGLAVVVDVHALATEASWMLADKSPADWDKGFMAFWGALAPALKDLDPEKVFLELLNEPSGMDQKLWASVQETTLKVVRAACPRHTVILTGDHWGGIDPLLVLKPAAERNVVYSFHVYEPHVFTHQGATWGAPEWKPVKGLLYPVNKANAEEVALAAAAKSGGAPGGQQAMEEVRKFAAEGWGPEKVRSHVGRAAAWAKKNNVALYLGEFGVIREGVNAESRAAWLRDMTRAAGEQGIGWAMWDYGGAFSMADGELGKRRIDLAIAGAIGCSTVGLPRGGGK